MIVCPECDKKHPGAQQDVLTDGRKGPYLRRLRGSDRQMSRLAKRPITETHASRSS